MTLLIFSHYDHVTRELIPKKNFKKKMSIVPGTDGNMSNHLSEILIFRKFL